MSIMESLGRMSRRKQWPLLFHGHSLVAMFAVLLAFCGVSTAIAQSQNEIDYVVNHMSIDAERDRLIEWLRTGTVDPNSVLGGTAAFDNVTLMHEASIGHLDVLIEAVRRGGDCNILDANGATPSHWAAAQRRGLGVPGAEALRVLARCAAMPDLLRSCDGEGRICTADPNIRDRRGGTPLHSLYQGVESAAAIATAEYGGARYDVLEVLLKDLRADPNIRNNDGDTPLMLMIKLSARPFFPPPDHTALLLRFGADPDTRNNVGNTALIEAVSPERPNAGHSNENIARVVRLLLENGADPNLRARNSDTPLIRAAKHKDDSLYEIRALIAGGADPCLRDRRGWIAHQYAEEAGAEASMAALEKAGGYLSFVNSVNGFCVADQRKAEERERQLGLDAIAKRKLQSCLKILGYDPGTGIDPFGPTGRVAIKAWQIAQGRKASAAMGFLSKDDREALINDCAAVAPQPLCDSQSSTGCWMATTRPENCYIWNRYPEPDEIVSWSGRCMDGKVTGYGMAQWKSVGTTGLQEIWDYEVTYREGRMADGPILSRSSAGDSFEGSLLNGQMQGHWLMRYSDGEIWEGPLAMGKREGLWVRTKPDFRIECYVNGHMQGATEFQDADSWANCDYRPGDNSRMQIAERTPLHAGPGSDYSTIQYLDEGAHVTVVGEIANWVRVELFDTPPDMIGFVSRGRLKQAAVAAEFDRNVICGDETKRTASGVWYCWFPVKQDQNCFALATGPALDKYLSFFKYPLRRDMDVDFDFNGRCKNGLAEGIWIARARYQGYTVGKYPHVDGDRFVHDEHQDDHELTMQIINGLIEGQYRYKYQSTHIKTFPSEGLRTTFEYANELVAEYFNGVLHGQKKEIIHSNGDDGSSRLCFESNYANGIRVSYSEC